RFNDTGVVIVPIVVRRAACLVRETQAYETGSEDENQERDGKDGHRDARVDPEPYPSDVQCMVTRLFDVIDLASLKVIDHLVMAPTAEVFARSASRRTVWQGTAGRGWGYAVAATLRVNHPNWATTPGTHVSGTSSVAMVSGYRLKLWGRGIA